MKRICCFWRYWRV